MTKPGRGDRALISSLVLHSVGVGSGDQFLDTGLLFHEVGERDARQEIVDPTLELSPHWSNAARRPRAAAFIVDRVGLAIDLERLPLAGRHDVANRNLLWRSTEEVAALGSPDALD